MTTQIVTENTTAQNATGTVSSGTEALWLQSTFPTTNRNNTGDIRTDYDAGPNFNGLIRFTIPTAPAGESLVSATIYLYQVNNSGNNETINIYATIPAWVESQATWNNYSTGNAWTTAGAQSGGNDRVATPTDSVAMTSGQSNAYYAFDVTADIGTYNAWVLEISTSDGTGGKNFGADDGTDGQRPELVLVYAAASGSSPSPIFETIFRAVNS